MKSHKCSGQRAQTLGVIPPRSRPCPCPAQSCRNCLTLQTSSYGYWIQKTVLLLPCGQRNSRHLEQTHQTKKLVQGRERMREKKKTKNTTYFDIHGLRWSEQQNLGKLQKEKKRLLGRQRKSRKLSPNLKNYVNITH